MLIQDFSKYSTSENPVLEISEVHFVLSRVFAGLGTLSLIALLGLLQNSHPIIAYLLTLPSLLCLLGILCLIFSAFLIKKYQIWLINSSLLIGSFYFAVIYRTHANKLLFYSTRNRNNGQPPNGNPTSGNQTSR